MIRAQDWRPAGGLALEPNALAAVVATERNVVVAAGPGAGKTELLAQRADFLLRTGQCPYPRRILAVSFKVDAARNLRTRVRLRAGAQLAARFDSFTFQAFAKRLIDNFRPALTGANALQADYRIDAYTRIAGEQITFADLVPLALTILEANRYARGGIRQTYSHVFLDEFQDTTNEQYELVKVAFGQSGAVLTAVGDVKQRIMAWAGALDGVLRTYADDFAADSLPLYQNFRSAPRLRRMQNRMIAETDPDAVSPAEDLVGDEGTIDVLDFDNEFDEALAVANLIEGWLDDGVPPSEIAVLVRNLPHFVAAALSAELMERGIAVRNEQESQDLWVEPVAALVFNFLRVVADDRQPDAYAELMRVVDRSSASEDEASRFDSRLKRFLRTSRAKVRDPGFDGATTSWIALVVEFMELVSRPVLIALSPSYQQSNRLGEVIEQALDSFGNALAVSGDASAALKRLSESDAVRILTIHKCKGLEFEKVVLLGVEEQLFWGDDPTEVASAFFVAISRAKNHLVLTWARHRERPVGYTKWWDEDRTKHQRFLGFAEGG